MKCQVTTDGRTGWLTKWHGDSLNDYYLEMFREGNLTNPVEADDVKDYGDLIAWVAAKVALTDLVNGAMSEVDWREIASHV